MEKLLSVEELVIDDTFINFCFGRNEEDCARWNLYVQRYPLEQSKVEEARKLVIGLHLVLAENNENCLPVQHESLETNRKRISRIVSYTVSAAAVIIAIVFAGRYLMYRPVSLPQAAEPVAQVQKHGAVRQFITGAGERKLIVLADSTKVWLNSGTTLTVSEDYGKADRKVTLSGEALFEVVHNERSPFEVLTKRSTVRDLGTTFNVRDYPNDLESETSLIEGKVEVSVRGSEQRVTLRPNQKLVVNNPVDSNDRVENSQPREEVSLRPLSYNHVDSVLVETAWVQNRLEINNESLLQMKDKLERWFGVKIIIKGDKVGYYPFTATFKQEDLEEVLRALQFAYHFNFKIENNVVTISE